MPLKSRSFLNRMNDRVRKRQNQSSKDAPKDSDKHSVIWGMFVSSTLQASVFMGKNYSDNLHSIKNTEDLTMNQMFDISEKLISEQSDEIYGVNTINWEDSSWKYLSLVGDEEVISLLHTKFYVFSDSVLCFGKMNENPQSNGAWEDRLTWFKSSPEYRALIPRTWIRKEMVFYSRIQSTRRMGQSCGANDVDICRKQTWSTSPLSRGTLKSKGGGKLSIHFCTDHGNDWNGFSHNYFC